MRSLEKPITVTVRSTHICSGKCIQYEGAVPIPVLEKTYNVTARGPYTCSGKYKSARSPRA
jgi:hypothetical protein